MKGCYCLIIYVKRKSQIKVGKKLGVIEFKKGIYVYIWSAMNSLESRLNRHKRQQKTILACGLPFKRRQLQNNRHYLQHWREGGMRYIPIP